MRDARAARLEKKEKKKKKRDFRVHLDSRANGSCDSPAFTVLGAPQGALRQNLRGMKGEDFDPVSLSRP